MTSADLKNENAPTGYIRALILAQAIDQAPTNYISRNLIGDFISSFRFQYPFQFGQGLLLDVHLDHPERMNNYLKANTLLLKCLDSEAYISKGIRRKPLQTI